MKRFEYGKKYMITQDARVLSIARVVEADGKRVTLEFLRGGKTIRLTERILSCSKPESEVVIPSDYDAIFAYNAIGKQ